MKNIKPTNRHCKHIPNMNMTRPTVGLMHGDYPTGF